MYRVGTNILKTMVLSSGIAVAILLIGLMLGYSVGKKSVPQNKATYFESKSFIWPDYYVRDNGDGSVDTVFVYRLGK